MLVDLHRLHDSRSRRSSVAPVFAAVVDVLASIADILTTVPRILATVADVLVTVEPILDTITPSAVVQRVTSILSRITHILPTVAHVLAPVAYILAPITHILPPVAQVLTTVPNQIPMKRANVTRVTLRLRHRRRASQQGRSKRSQSQVTHFSPSAASIRRSPVVACAHSYDAEMRVPLTRQILPQRFLRDSPSGRSPNALCSLCAGVSTMS